MPRPRACLLRQCLQMFQRLSRETRGEISTSGVHFYERRSPTGEMLDNLSAHVSQLLVWVGRKVESAGRGRRAQSQKVRGQRRGTQPRSTTVCCLTHLVIYRLKCLQPSKIHTASLLKRLPGTNLKKQLLSELNFKLLNGVKKLRNIIQASFFSA